MLLRKTKLKPRVDYKMEGVYVCTECLLGLAQLLIFFKSTLTSHRCQHTYTQTTHHYVKIYIYSNNQNTSFGVSNYMEGKMQT